MTSTRSVPVVGSPVGSVSRKIKTKIIKTYHHDISLVSQTYDELLARTDLTLEDSDPDETQNIMSSMILNSERMSHRSQGDVSLNRATKATYSIGGVSTIDSGVVSRDSLLDQYREMSVSRSERSESPCSRYSGSLTRRSSSQGRGEFDPLSRTALLDSRLRSRSRSRIEEQKRGNSPCRSHGVKNMINFFEGSQENVSSPACSVDTTSVLSRRVESSHPLIKQPLYTSPVSPLRLAQGRASRRRTGSPTTAVPDTEESISNASSRTKQENALHLTCVASGYTKYSPYSDRKTYQRGDGEDIGQSPLSSTDCLRSTQTSSNNQLNGANTDATLSLSNGIVTPHVNGHIDSASPHSDSSDSTNVNSNNHVSTRDSVPVSAEHIDIDIVTGDKSTPEVLSNGITEGGPDPTPREPAPLDQVDRSALVLTLDNESLVSSQRDEVKLTNGVSDGAQDSTTIKDGAFFLKETDGAQNKLLGLSEVAQRDLDTPNLTEEVSGQIRAAIGKAHLLIDKKFKQFRGLCDKNLTQGPDEPFPTTSEDLAGFWDLVYLQVENCETSFSDIDTLRANGWVQEIKVDMEDAANKPVTPRGHKTIAASISKSEPKAKGKSPSKPTAKARDEARKRLMAAKKAMRERRNSETDDVIYVASS